MSINKHYREVKRVIRKHTQLVDPYFLNKYTFSPYMACQHGCKYCDGRAEKYHVDGDFEKDIVIRKNFKEIFPRELSKLREPGFLYIGSGISDSYQPIEADEKFMAFAADKIFEFGYPAAVMTKSNMILRDLEVWKKVHESSCFILMVSLTTLDDRIRMQFEPGAASVEDRLDLLKRFKDAGMFVGVSAMPFLPFISDSREQIDALVDRLNQIPIDFMFYGCLTLRPGKQKNTYFKVIEQFHPNLLSEYKVLYGDERPSGNPTYQYRKSFYEKAVHSIYLDGHIPVQIPHYIYRNNFPVYDEIFILMNHMTELYSIMRNDTSRLNDSLEKYSNWLLEEKRYFNRHRKISFREIEKKLIERFRSESFLGVLQNGKLFEFLKKVILDRGVFNYYTLELEQE